MGDDHQGHDAGTVISGDGGSRRHDVDPGGHGNDRDADLRKQLAVMAARARELEDEVLEARHAQLINRDHVVGIEAEIGRQNADILRLSADLRRLQGREKRLRARKAAQAKRIDGLETKLAAARKRNAALTRRVSELEASIPPPSLARRVARRLRRSAR